MKKRTKIKSRFIPSKEQELRFYLENNEPPYPRYSDRQQINDTLKVIKDNVDDIREVVNK